ncbi:MAG TPA: hypothetical protein VK324_06345 [Tepidisphaeraceae bacterium]|nr:hypothetical protein [Tepidisphaeraceae bacterium]
MANQSKQPLQHEYKSADFDKDDPRQANEAGEPEATGRTARGQIDATEKTKADVDNTGPGTTAPESGRHGA